MGLGGGGGAEEDEDDDEDLGAKEGNGEHESYFHFHLTPPAFSSPRACAALRVLDARQASAGGMRQEKSGICFAVVFRRFC